MPMTQLEEIGDFDDETDIVTQNDVVPSISSSNEALEIEDLDFIELSEEITDPGFLDSDLVERDVFGSALANDISVAEEAAQSSKLLAKGIASSNVELEDRTYNTEELRSLRGAPSETSTPNTISDYPTLWLRIKRSGFRAASKSRTHSIS